MKKEPLREMLREYADASYRGIKPKVLGDYANSIEQFSEFLRRPASPSDLTDEQLERFRLYRESCGKAAKTITQNLQHLLMLRKWSLNKFPKTGPAQLRGSSKLLLKKCVERYILSRDICHNYAESLRARVACFCKWHGSDIHVGHLNAELVNRWLVWLKETKELSSYSLCGYRAAILSLWTSAYEDGDCDNPPLRLRKIKKAPITVRAFTHAEILVLLNAAAELFEVLSDGNLARDFWRAAILAAYSTGLRRGDLLSVPWSAVSTDGSATVTQHKTGNPVRVQFSPEAMQIMTNLYRPNRRAIPWPYGSDFFSKKFKRIATAAGMPHCQFKMLRRSAGSYAEAQRSGDGRRLLGHRSEQVFTKHYEDLDISKPAAINPPPITPPMPKDGDAA